MKTLLGRAISIAAEAFEGVHDKGGSPYILHCLWVMNKVRHLGADYMIVAVLHDLVEDTHWTIEDLRREGFSESILYSIDTISKKKGQLYMDYIEGVAINPMARAVKLRDLEHNSKITRLKDLTRKDKERMFKYHQAYTYLKSV